MITFLRYRPLKLNLRIANCDCFCDKSTMDEAKKKRLEKRGWKTGSVKDFLELSEEEARLVELKLAANQKTKATPPKPQKETTASTRDTAYNQSRSS